MSTKRLRIAELARINPQTCFTSLNQYLDESMLNWAWEKTNKTGAAGVDGMNAQAYEEVRAERMVEVLTEAKSGRYRAPPVRRVHVPKPGSKERRPIGIPTIEDRVLQRAVAGTLEPIFEHDFLDCSYGFRPGRSAHHALTATRNAIMEMGPCWIIDMDIRKYFDTISHQHLRVFLDQRVCDGVIRRLIDKWLKAGVLEEGQLTLSKAGSPQGGVISPLLANLYLHHVLDLWIAETVSPCLVGKVELVRYADDSVLIFQYESDARRVMEVLPKRFERFGLTLHPEKTTLSYFSPENSSSSEPPKGRKSRASFDFLGFRHYWALSRRGNWYVKAVTAPDRFTRGLQAIHLWCRNNRHKPMKEQHAGLSRRLHGHYAYYGIRGNSKKLQGFRYQAACRWRYWLNRRGRSNTMHWERFWNYLNIHPLPPARIARRFAQ